MDGHVIPGTVLAFYPGTVMIGSDMRDYPEVAEENEYMISRFPTT